MIEELKITLQSVEELIFTLRPVRAAAINGEQVEAALPELRQIKQNVSAVLLFASNSSTEEAAHSAEFRHLLDEIRRECLLLNGMISRVIFRQRWLFSVNRIENARDILAHYENVATAAYKICRLLAPELDDSLLIAF